MNGRGRKAGRKAHRVNFIGQGVNMAQAVKNSGSLRVIILQNKLDTPHYACDFNAIWEALGGLLREDQPPAVAMTRG